MSDNKKLASKYETLISKNMELMVENEKLTSDLERMNCQFGKENQTQANTTGEKHLKLTLIKLLLHDLKLDLMLTMSYFLQNGKDLSAAVTTFLLRGKTGQRAGKTVRGEEQICW